MIKKISNIKYVFIIICCLVTLCIIKIKFFPKSFFNYTNNKVTQYKNIINILYKSHIAYQLNRIQHASQTHHSHYINIREFKYNPQITFIEQLINKTLNENIFRHSMKNPRISYFLVKNCDNFFKIVEQKILSNKLNFLQIEKTYRNGIYKIHIQFSLSDTEKMMINGTIDNRPIGILVKAYKQFTSINTTINKALYYTMVVNVLTKRILSFYPSGNGEIIEKDTVNLFLEDMISEKIYNII